MYQNPRLSLVIKTAQSLALSCWAASALKKQKPLQEAKDKVMKGEDSGVGIIWKMVQRSLQGLDKVWL